MGWFRNQAVFFHVHTKCKGILVQVWVDNHCIQKTFTAHFVDYVVTDLVLKLSQRRAKELTTFCRSFSQIFFNKNLQCSKGNFAGNRGTTISTSMLSWVDIVHNLIVTENRRNRVRSSGERLSKNDNIWAHILVIDCKHLTGTAEPSLHLVSNHQDVVLGTEVSYALQVAIVRDEYASFSLNWFQHVACNVGVAFELGLQSL
mmetsp:Transcript_12018/g.19560  ORF Transcript_12018/g.19560 Transcript_12018/m.19560 type:complete len:202 (+) Transcript_12018:141-746(+)